MPFSRHTRRSVFSIGAASLAAAFLFLTPENTHAADTTAKIHILTLDSGSNAIVLESVDDNGQKIFGMVDSGEDWVTLTDLIRVIAAQRHHNVDRLRR